MIFIATDILSPYKREILSQDSYNTLIDFLVEKFPDGFKRPTDISVNGHEVALADYDIELKEDDVIVLLDRAALPVSLIGGWFITALANLAISVTLSYVANKLFAPDAPQDQGTPSSVYNLNSAQNMARYGAPIPIVYGKVRMFPSMIVQPYYKFEDNVEYLYHVLCIGQGTMTASEVLIGDDLITNTGDFDYKFLYQNSFYDIPLNAYGVHLSKTLSVPSGMELKGDGGAVGVESEKYTISADASKVEFDYMYPNGLFYVKSDGSYYQTSSSFVFRIYTLSGSTYTEVFSIELLDSTMTIDAIQKTYTKDISAYNEPVYVSFQRKTYYYHPRDTHDLYIKRVKEIYPNEDFTNKYGDITLLACKIKATNTVSSAGQLKVNGYFTRTDVGNTMHEVLTDLYTNTTYGAGLNASDLNFPVTTETVDCAYDSSMTIFDAMRKPALAQGYSLYLAGMDVILKKDAANPITSGMYNEMNILRNSFKAQYLFKEEHPAYDGFQCTYIDGDGWIQRSEKYPELCTRPQVVDLFGLVDWHPIIPTGLNLQYMDSYTNPLLDGALGIDIDTTNGLAYIASSVADTLTILDISNPYNITYVSSLAGLNGARCVKIYGALVYVMAQGRLYSIDVSDKYNMQIITFAYISSGDNMVLRDSYAYVASSDASKLTIVDISNPSSMFVKGSYTSTTNIYGAYGISISGSYAYLGCLHGDSITSLDISDPTDIKVGHVYKSANINGGLGVKIVGSTAFLVSVYTNMLIALDISDPLHITEISNIYDPSISGHNLTIVDNVAYIASDAVDTVISIDISDPSNMVKRSEITSGVYLNGVWQSEAYGTTLVAVSSLYDGVATIDIT